MFRLINYDTTAASKFITNEFHRNSKWLPWLMFSTVSTRRMNHKQKHCFKYNTIKCDDSLKDIQETNPKQST